MGIAKDTILAGLGAAIGGALSTLGTPHYDDIETSDPHTNRTSAYGDVVWFRTICGAFIGAAIGGIIAGATDSSTTPAPPTTPTSP